MLKHNQEEKTVVHLCPMLIAGRMIFGTKSGLFCTSKSYKRDLAEEVVIYK